MYKRKQIYTIYYLGKVAFSNRPISETINLINREWVPSKITILSKIEAVE
jgi:hypothetical protein